MTDKKPLRAPHYSNRLSGGICLNCKDNYHDLCWDKVHTDQLYSSCFCQHKDNSDGRYHEITNPVPQPSPVSTPSDLPDSG